MPEVFDPPIPPQEGPAGRHRFNVSEVRFGEGYVATTGEGLNPKVQTWPLSFKGTWAEVQPIIDFFDAHEGHIRFLWTPPMQSVQKLWIVKEYDTIPEGGLNATVTATLEERFGP